MNTRHGIYLAAGAVLFAAAFTDAQAQVSVDGELAAVSNYAWRGFSLADQPVLQPGITLGFGDTGLALEIWGSAAMADRGVHEGADELDFTLGFDRTLDAQHGIGLSLGYIQYTFPNAPAGERHSEEVYAGVSVDNRLAPSLTAFYDFGLLDGLYLSAAVSPEFPLGADGAPVLALEASLDASDYFDRGFGFHAAQLSASVGFERGGLTFSPVVGYSHADSEVNLGNSEFWAGLSASFSR